MRRRDFIAVIGGSAAAAVSASWPLAAPGLGIAPALLTTADEVIA